MDAECFRTDQHEVPVSPDPREPGEVGVAVFLSALVRPELDWHGGEGRHTDELPGLAEDLSSLLVPGLDTAAQVGALNRTGKWQVVLWMGGWREDWVEEWMAVK